MAGRAAGPDRAVAFAGIAIRLAGVVILAVTLPFDWSILSHPGWSAIAVAAATAESFVVIWWFWRRRHLPTVVAIADAVFGAALVWFGQWSDTGLLFTYTVMISFTSGLASRRIYPAIAAGLGWVVAGALPHLANDPATAVTIALGSVPSYLVNPLIGALCARLLRRMADQLDRARAEATAQAAEIAVAAQRVRNARALHDRVLQTMETLARGDSVPDKAMQLEVVAQAEWLRSFVETGRTDQSDNLSTGLAAASRAVARTGADVQLNDAALRSGEADGDGTVGLTARQRDALVDATHHAIAAVAGAGRVVAGRVIVRATPDSGGVLVTVLAGEPTDPLPEQDLADVASRLGSVGGRIVVEPVPYLELWVPAGSQTHSPSGPHAPDATPLPDH